MRNFFGFILILFLAILQAALAPHFKILGAVPNLVFAAIVIFALKKNDGLVFLQAFLAGLILDAFSSLPPGVFAFLLPFLAWGIKFFGKNLLQTGEFFGKTFLLAASSFAFSFLYILLADFFQNFGSLPEIDFWRGFFRIGLIEAAWNFLFMFLLSLLFFRKKEPGLI